MTEMSTLYSVVRAACGDHGIYDDSGDLIANSYIYQDNVIGNTMALALMEISGYSASEYTIEPSLTSGSSQEALLVYWTALYLLLPEREISVKTPALTITKESVKSQIELIVSRISTHLANGTVPYSSDGAWNRLYNAATRKANQLSGISE